LRQARCYSAHAPLAVTPYPPAHNRRHHDSVKRQPCYHRNNNVQLPYSKIDIAVVPEADHNRLRSRGKRQWQLLPPCKMIRHFLTLIGNQ
jgi:hypothetical protein